MSRWDYDVSFYRVFCISLLVVAFSFTVILTNVFIDIDGLLSRKDKDKTRNTDTIAEKANVNLIPDDTKTEILYNDERNYDEDEDSYRTKRSLDSQDLLLNIKNPKLKNIITKRLATLLEELDAEETKPDTGAYKKRYIKQQTERVIENPIEETEIKENKVKERKDQEIRKVKDMKGKDREESSQVGIENNDKTTEGFVRDLQNDNLLHLAMHNILLQGIIGHMDLNNVYKKVHSLINGFNNVHDFKKENSAFTRKRLEENPTPIFKQQTKSSGNLENRFFDELINCNTLQNQIAGNTTENNPKVETRQNDRQRGSKILIKTIIDITSLNDDKKNHTNSRDIQGVVKVIYNGKPIKLNKLIDGEDNPFYTERNKILNDMKTSRITMNNIKNDVSESTPSEGNNKNTKSYLNKVIDAYFRRYGDNTNSKSIETERFIDSKRIKRQVKVQDENENLSEKSNGNEKGIMKDDDELYVEIETHFDSKGMRGEKKKKLIRNLIDKIQKAIHSNVDNQEAIRKKKHKHIHVKKRIQNPLVNKDEAALINKAILPLETIVHRQLDPISKVAFGEDILPKVYDKSGETWKQSYTGPGFLTQSKSLNSAEMGQVDVDYNKVMDMTGIPQRLQKPLNADVDEELNNNYYNKDNVKFFLKDIDGSGFSIGFNQYTDEAPDLEAMKLFTGVENLINTYHQNYDQETRIEGNDQIGIQNNNNNYEYRNNEVIASGIENKKSDLHNIKRRSTSKQSDYHSNEYKIIFDENFLPYNSYQEIFDNKKDAQLSLNENDDTESNNQNSHKIKLTTKHNNKLRPLMIDEDIFDRSLKPVEILTLANFLKRKKRTITLSNVKSKIKLNKYLNTNAMTTKRIILKNKRNKRQINKIRIIARDDSSKLKQSDENIFVMSNENMLADRAVIKEVETPEEIEIPDKQEEHVDYAPYIYDQPNLYTPYSTNDFNNRHRHNLLMSKYPHIFMDEMGRSKENILPEEPLYFEKVVENLPQIAKYNVKNSDGQDVTESYIPTALDVPISRMEEMVDNINPQGPKTNYKLTVKIMPKNLTGMPSGFKEIHTSINKSFNKNGLRYSSLVNVSEISRIENIMKKKKDKYKDTTSQSPYIINIKHKEEKIKNILKRHKQRIDAQLDHLQKEKEHLESMIVKNENYSSESVDLMLPLTPPQIVRVRKDDINKLAASALLSMQELQNDTELNKIPITSSNIPTTTLSTTILTTKEPEKTTITNIVKNDILTQEILKRIDQNTVMLQRFLQKLTEKVTPVKVTTTKPINDELNIPKDWKSYQPIHEPFFGQAMPEIEVRKNDTHVSIPFIYAYQQPFPLANKPDAQNAPVASVVYHGHIHTNAVRKNRETWKQNSRDIAVRNNVKKIVNGSKFFIDDLDNEYKVAPNSLLKKDVFSKLPLAVKFNNTNH